ERATLDTRVFPPGQADLPALFERLTAPNPNNPSRKVTYKLLRPDYLVVTGETDTGRFYTRYAAGPAGVRGYNLGYDKALAKDLEILVVAIANAFEPFPGAAPTPDPVPPRVAAPLTGPAPAALPSATGLVVGPRRVLTADIEACPQPRIGSAPARIVSIDKGAGLMLLEADAGRAVPLAPGALPEAGGLVALAYAPGKPGRALVAVAGERGPAGILAPLQPGAAGAPVFDRTGRLVGLVRGMPTDLRLVAGVAIPAGYALAGGEALAAALKGGGGPVAPASTGERSAGEIATAMAAAIVPVECGR
ncbi:MAG TPA: serine protease, partial [Salinarimonas sp.]|nr:serine protease [Salinarimonas sp.]